MAVWRCTAFGDSADSNIHGSNSGHILCGSSLHAISLMTHASELRMAAADSRATISKSLVLIPVRISTGCLDHDAELFDSFFRSSTAAS